MLSGNGSRFDGGRVAFNQANDDDEDVFDDDNVQNEM